MCCSTGEGARAPLLDWRKPVTLVLVRRIDILPGEAGSMRRTSR
jgi:hypothetical protein